MALRPMVQPHRASWAIAIGATLLAFYPSPTLAQIAGDGTLGTQVNGSLTAPCTGTCIITNGATRGSNLFHSFQQFSLPNGDFAGFVTTPAIQNVIVRVTGVGQPFISNINGTIATVNAAVTAINPANFFLLNPNGIIFGPNAALNIGGSFLATTANRMQFADGTEFRTTDPAPLLTVSVPTGLQFGQAPGNIQMQGVRLSAVNKDSFSDFAIVGGDITLDNSIVEAPGQRVELGGVATGIVRLSVNGNNLNLDLPDDVKRADISLLNGSLVRVDADGGGNIAINSRNLDLSGGSVLLSGISQGLGLGNRQAGNITVNATGAITAEGGSAIASQVFQGRTGSSGNIQIKAQSLSFSTSALLLATTFGNGNAGNITINAQEGVSFDGAANGGFNSGIYNTVEETGRGKAGNIEINSGSLLLTRGAQLDSSVFGRGEGGNIIIHARQSVVFDGVSPDGFQSAALSEILETGEGQGGAIQIMADSLTVTNGAQLNTSTRNVGNAGDITIDVRDRVLFSEAGLARTAVNEGAIGNGGDIQITAGSVVISSGGILNAFTAGAGKAGNVTINARDAVVLDGQNANDFGTAINSNLLPTGKGRGGDISISAASLIVKNGATIQTASDGQGDAGTIIVNARETVLVTGQDAFSGNSGLATLINENGKGKGGDIQITANSVLLTDNGGLVSTTLGQGDAGSITIDARNTVLFDRGFALSNTQSLTGGNANNINISTDLFSVTNQSALSTTNTFGEGNAGNVLISANNAEFSTGGRLLTATSGSRNAGSITLNISDRLTLSGTNTGLFANTAPGSSGNGGSIFIDPRTVTIQDGATIAVDSKGSGIGGNISIQAGRLELRDRGSITAETASAQGGNIALDVKDLVLLRRNSSISATAGTAQAGGDGGNVTIQAPFIVGVLRENSDIIANAFTGRGGNITINTNAIYGLQFQPQLTPFSDITASSQFGINGTVAINTLNLDPSRGLAALPLNLTDPSQQISQSCTPGAKTAASSFVSTGRGGIPLNPDEPLESRSVVTKWVALPEEGGRAGAQGRQGEQEGGRDFKAQSAIVEAQGWVVKANGTMELVANRATGDRANVWAASVPCQTAQGH